MSEGEKRRGWPLSRRLKTWRTAAIVAGVTGYVIAGVGIWLANSAPIPIVALLLCAPWLALLLNWISAGHMLLGTGSSFRWPPVLGDLVDAPSIALAIVGWFELPIHPLPLVVPAMAGLAFGVLFDRLIVLPSGRRHSDPIVLVASAMALSASAAGGAAVLNARLAQPAAANFETTIVDTYVTRGRHSGVTHFILAPWGPFSDQTDIEVTLVMASHLRLGDKVCMQLHPGAFGMQWAAYHPLTGKTGIRGCPNQAV